VAFTTTRNPRIMERAGCRRHLQASLERYWSSGAVDEFCCCGPTWRSGNRPNPHSRNPLPSRLFPLYPLIRELFKLLAISAWRAVRLAPPSDSMKSSAVGQRRRFGLDQCWSYSVIRRRGIAALRSMV
jgi:hypothetical protein